MGDFIKDLNIIDFLGMLIPGMVVMLLVGAQYPILQIVEQYFGSNEPNIPIRITFLLVGGYVLGNLLHEVGDLLEKGLWCIIEANPRTYAACATGIWQKYQEKADKEKDKNEKMPVYLQGILAAPFLIVVYFTVFNDLKAAVVLSLITVFLLKYLGWELLFRGNSGCQLHHMHYIIKNDAVFYGDGGENAMAKRKQILFEGFRTMSRNLLITMFLVRVYAKWGIKRPVEELVGVFQCGMTHVVCTVLVVILLARYYHYSFLKYKYCYEDAVYKKCNKTEETSNE